MDSWRGALTEPELRTWGERIGGEVETPVVIALHGDLGAGKSTLARAVAHGAGVEGSVPSPTFNLLFSYQTVSGRRVQHFDLYRLERPEEVWELGWGEWGADDLVLIEWAERAATLLPEVRWDVTLEETVDPERREVTAEPVGGPPTLPAPVGNG